MILFTHSSDIPLISTLLLVTVAAVYGVCPTGWSSYANRCFRLYTNETVDRATARSRCESQSAQLVSIHNTAEHDFIKSKLSEWFTGAGSPEGTHKIWLGLNLSWSQQSGGTVQSVSWLDTSAVDYGTPVYSTFAQGSTPWNSGEPNNGGGGDEKCAHMYQSSTLNGQWNDEACTTPMYYMCATPIVCSDGWSSHHGRCYRLFTDETVDQTTALVRCVLQNANLVAIHDTVEWGFLRIQLSNWYAGKSGEFYFWTAMGLTWTAHPGTPPTNVDSVSLTDDTNPDYFNPMVSGFTQGAAPWKSGEPNNGAAGNENCVHMYQSSSNNGFWNDARCNTPMYYICKQ